MEKVKNILITGGSGMIGRRLTTLLAERGYEVSHLGRTKRNTGIRTYTWDLERGVIEKNALRNVDVIIHLAGAGIADKRWNTKRKKEIFASRVASARLLVEAVKTEALHLSAFISASGTSYYGLEDRGNAFVEEDISAEDFMARVTVAWEHEVSNLEDTVRVVKIRAGAVLSTQGGALKKLAMPVKFFVGAPLGSGKQYVNWIHIDDLCRIYIKAVEDVSMKGAYNAVAPNPVSNLELTREIARVLRKPLWAPRVPGFVVRLIAGEVAGVVLKGGEVSSSKIENAGFDFQYKTVRAALEELYRKPRAQ